jgi:hypothetical protein
MGESELDQGGTTVIANDGISMIANICLAKRYT